jgi:hypothetical protein
LLLAGEPKREAVVPPKPFAVDEREARRFAV